MAWTLLVGRPGEGGHQTDVGGRRGFHRRKANGNKVETSAEVLTRVRPRWRRSRGQVSKVKRGFFKLRFLQRLLKSALMNSGSAPVSKRC